MGTEYIIQEHVDGVQLHEQWPSMDSPQHMLCTKNLTLKIREMASLDFPAYGNIYFADAPIREGLKIPLESGFCIGPYCSPLFWNCGTGEAALYGKRSPNCGPCMDEYPRKTFMLVLNNVGWEADITLGRNLAEYASGLVDTAFSRIPEQQSTSGDRLPFRGTIQEHIRLLHACRETMQILVADRRVQAAGTPTLIHADYNKRNIYVSPEDPTLITGLIDWQLTCVEPAFIYAHATPDFAALPDENPAEDEHTTQMSQSDDAKRLLKDISICHQTYDAVMKGMIPKIRPARLLDSVFFRLFLYCFTTWRDGVPAVRQELLDLKALWTEMELPGSCPYSPTEEELRDHSRQYEDFETTQKLKTWLKTSLQTTSDGWFPNEAWEAAKEAHSAAFAEWMETAREAEARGDDMTVEKAERLWPFDHR